jgi:dTMP kinase
MSRRLPGGVLLAFDGIDGAGKTTQATMLGDSLARHGFEVVRTKEPTNGPWGRRLRESALTGRLSPKDELAAFVEDRREHVRDLITPSLAAGKIVILDRYYFSTVAYQGARGMNVENIIAMNEVFAPAPDALFLLQVSPRVGLDRVAARGDIANLFEREDNLLACARIFDSIERPFVRRVDGDRDPKTIAEEILWGVCEGPIADRLAPSPSGPTIRPDKIAAFVAAAKRISADRSIAVGDKPDALLDLVENYVS